MKKRSRKMVLLLVLCIVVSFGLTVPALAAKKPKKPKLISVKVSGSYKVTIKWKKAKNAKKYELYASIDGGKFKKISTGKKRSYVHKDVEPGHTYRYKVRATNGKKKSGYSKTKSVTIKKTTKDYYTDLKKIILDGGKRDDDEVPWICLEDEDDDFEYEYSIRYNLNTSAFVFRMSLIFDVDDDDEYEESVEFNINDSILKKGKTKVNYCSFSLEDEDDDMVDIYSTLDMASYKRGKTLSWSGTGFDLEEVSSSMDLAFEGWETLLRKEAGLDLKKLGFTDYK